MGGIRLGGGLSISSQSGILSREIDVEWRDTSSRSWSLRRRTIHTHTHDVDTIDSSITNRRSDQTHKYIMSPISEVRCLRGISGQSSAVPIHLKIMENLISKTTS